MGDDKPSDGRSKFSYAGNEQGSAAVQPDGHKVENEGEGGKRSALEKEEQQGRRQRLEQDDIPGDEPEDPQNDDQPGIFSALLGDGRRA